MEANANERESSPRWRHASSCSVHGCRPSPRSPVTPPTLFSLGLFVPERSRVGLRGKKVIPFPGLMAEAGGSDMS